MFNLTVDLKQKKGNVSLSNSRDLSRHLEYLCKSFTGGVNDFLVFELNKNNSFNMSRSIVKNIVKWSIYCDSYDITLKLVQGIFGFRTLQFQGYEFEVSSLDMKEINEKQLGNEVVTFISA